MFEYYCHHCENRTVLFPSQLKRLVNDEQGIVTILECWCGELGAVRTGSKHSRPVAEVLADAELIAA